MINYGHTHASTLKKELVPHVIKTHDGIAEKEAIMKARVVLNVMNKHNLMQCHAWLLKTKNSWFKK